MPKPNYVLARRQKEAARKARQLKKLDRRQGRPDEPPADGAASAAATPAETPAETPAAPRDGEPST
jgi:hypothetical protein